jgi:hypothetical protein
MPIDGGPARAGGVAWLRQPPPTGQQDEQHQECLAKLNHGHKRISRTQAVSGYPPLSPETQSRSRIGNLY